MTPKEFLYRLFFDAEDGLDLFQVLYYLVVVVTLVIVWRITGSSATPETIKEGLITLRYMIGLLVVTAVPKWMATLMLNKKNDPTITKDDKVS